MLAALMILALSGAAVSAPAPEACAASAAVTSELIAEAAADGAPVFDVGDDLPRPLTIYPQAPVAGLWRGPPPSAGLYARWRAAPARAAAAVCPAVIEAIAARGARTTPGAAEPASVLSGAPKAVTRSVGRAVLSADGREALVEVRVRSNGVEARDELYRLRKTGGAWRVVAEGLLAAA